MCQVNLVRLQNGGGFNSDEGTITVRTVTITNRVNTQLRLKQYLSFQIIFQKVASRK